MKIKAPVIIVVLLLAAVFYMAFTFTVREYETALKLRLGEIAETGYEPGLHFKWPVVQNIRKFPRRILTISDRPERIFTAENEAVQVDFFVKWRIEDPATYYTSFQGDERRAALRLLQIVKNGLQLEFDNRTIRQVVSDERSEMMENLTTKGNTEVAQFGIEIVDVRVKQIELPDDVRNSVFERMRAERERIAKELRAQGQENAKGIQAVAERERTVILAEASRDAEMTRGEGDARATEIYADAFGRDQEFFQFYRSMNAYRASLASQQDVLVLEPDSEFFRYFHGNISD